MGLNGLLRGCKGSRKRLYLCAASTRIIGVTRRLLLLAQFTEGQSTHATRGRFEWVGQPCNLAAATGSDRN